MNDPSEEFRYSLSLFLTDKFTRLKKSSKQFLTIMMCKRRLTPEPDPMITLKNCAFYILMSFYAVQCGTIFCHQHWHFCKSGSGLSLRNHRWWLYVGTVLKGKL